MKILALAAPIPMGGNLPIEFLLEASDIELTTLYVVPGLELPDPLPKHDLAFVLAPGDSGITYQFFQEIERITENWPVPVLNSPELIKRLERDQLSETLSGVDNVRIPKTQRVSRQTLQDITEANLPVDLLCDLSFPVIIRPIGSHAGWGMAKLDGQEALAPYLAKYSDSEFFLSEFVDYKSDDGQYRKYRIVFIDGQPWPVHMAICDQWKLWYMNAGMNQSAEKRNEEAHFMQSFDANFANRHRAVFNGLSNAVGLDYFGIDCAELADGTLVIFEADSAMIVHDLDPPEIYPYKSPVMQALFKRFVDMLHMRRLAAKGAPRPIIEQAPTDQQKDTGSSRAVA